MSNIQTFNSDEDLPYIPSSTKIINNEPFDPKNFPHLPQENIPHNNPKNEFKEPGDVITNPNTDSIYDAYVSIVKWRTTKNQPFSTRHYKNRGTNVPSKSFLEKKHGRDDFDNLQTKIQVHFINFLINLVNDAVKAEFNSKDLIDLVINDPNNKKKSSHDFFRHINYQAKKRIDHDHIMKILQKPVKDIITEDISLKYKTLNTNLDYNKKLYEKLIEKSKWLADFLDLKYIDVFNKYYNNNEKPLDKIDFKEKTIKISSKTKSFYYLLEKNRTMDKLDKLMINLVKNVYLYENNKGNPFITVKTDN